MKRPSCAGARTPPNAPPKPPAPPSRNEAKRLIKGGGARVDGEQVKDEAARVTLGAEPVRVSAGKKLHGLVVRA
jgi:tyrosyl-tRNA synthetase